MYGVRSTQEYRSGKNIPLAALSLGFVLIYLCWKILSFPFKRKRRGGHRG